MQKIQELVNLSKNRAKQENTEHVLPEHLAYELLLLPEIKKQIAKFGIADITFTLEELDKLIKSQAAPFEVVPEISFSFEFIIKQALAFALLSGKKSATSLDLFISLIKDESYSASKILKTNGLNIKAFIDHFYNTPQKIVKDADGKNKKSDPKDDDKSKPSTSIFTPAKNLERYTEDYIALAKEGKFQPLFGREKEIEKIIHTLTRKTKNSVILVGDPGVGKTAIIEGLANQIANKKGVPHNMYETKIYSLDINNLIAGAKHHGSFEERIKGILDELKVMDNAILFIDDIQNMVGNGGSGSMDLAAILKNYMSRGSLKLIGCLTDEDFRRSLDKDRTMLRRFYKIDVNESSPAESVEILKGLKSNFEKHYSVVLDDSAIETSVELAAKYLHDRRLPDKAIDLLDSTIARNRLLTTEKTPIVTRKEVVRELSNFIKVADIVVDEDDKTKLKNLKDRLLSKIYGQDEAIEKLAKVIYVSKSGLRSSEKTVANILFQGPTASGKTELSKELAKNIGVELVRFDLSTYQEKFTLSALIGSPPGYLGYSDGKAGEGLLITAIEKNPNCVLLLDEVEKAHPDVLNILLQVMDYGILTSASGKSVSCRNVILIMTSNIGAEVEEKNRIGFGNIDNSDKCEDIFKTFFRPEFRSRLDSVIRFKKLGVKELERIVLKFIDELFQQLAKQNISITLNDSALAYFTQKAANSNSGARIVSSLIDDEIKPKMAEILIYSDKPKDSYEIIYDGGSIQII